MCYQMSRLRNIRDLYIYIIITLISPGRDSYEMAPTGHPGQGGAEEREYEYLRTNIDEQIFDTN